MGTLPQLIEEDVQRLDEVLRELITKSEAEAGLVIDKGGFLVAHRGHAGGLDTMTLAALAAGSFAATQAMANIVNEPDFSCICQQGKIYSLIIHNVNEQTLLIVLAKSKVSIGAVKYYASSAIEQVAEQLRFARNRDPFGGLDLSVLNIADPRGLFRKKA
jgi:predicted regulator of Ras-like GTPase activity (Roadblock/LC7/MglB family)